jgi:hypothetical protein
MLVGNTNDVYNVVKGDCEVEGMQLFCFVCGQEEDNIDFIATNYDEEEILVCKECDAKIYTHIQNYKHRLEQFLKKQERTVKLIDLLKKERKKEKVSYSLLGTIEHKHIVDSFGEEN